MDALILAGGFATRLEPITLFVPKQLLPVGGKPIIDYIVEDLMKNGIHNIVVSTNSKFVDQFKYWIEHRKALGKLNGVKLIVEPAMHDGEKFGAIKGINYTLEQGGLDDDLVIVAGDNFYDFSLKRMLDHFNKYRKPTIALHDIKSIEDAKRFGVVSAEGHIIKGFEEKPKQPRSTLVSTGIYMFPKEMLGKFKDYIDDNNNPDAPGYFIQWLLKNEEIHGVVYSEDWYDIGTIDTYKKVFDSFLNDKT